MTINEVFLIVITCFIFVLIITPVIGKIANHVGAIDTPNERKVHKKLTPRLGGLGIFVGFLLGYMLFSEQSIEMISILIGSFIIVVTGVIDDIKPLPAKYKLIGQILAALVVTVYGGLLITELDFMGIYLHFGMLSTLITIIVILGIINCINLIDGLDGLAAGVCSIFFLTVGIIAFIQSNLGGLDIVLSFIMLGATLGFLVHNFNPAKIFMGDTGSMFLGFIIAIIAIIGFKNVTLTSFVVPVLILAIPILDTLFAIIRRLLKGESISKPDKMHLHHQLLNMKFSHRNTVLIIYLMTSLFAFSSIVYVLNDPVIGKILYALIFILIISLVLGTDIIMDKIEMRKKLHLRNKFHLKKK